MTKWSFNMLLLSRLSDVLDISGAEIARRCGLTQQVLNRYMNGDIVLSVQVLMKICNAMRMPAYHFVSEDGSSVLPIREEATLPLDCWHPIEWDIQAVELTFGDGEGRIFWKDVAKVMDISSQKPHERFLLRKRFPVDGFFTACSHYGISPFRFLIDPNRKGAKRQLPTPLRGGAGGGVSPSEIADLQRKLSDLSAIVDDLTSKFSALLERHNLLENRFRSSLGDSLPLAADDPHTGTGTL